MLDVPVFIFNPLPLGGGVYTIDLFWQSTLAAQFLNLGDHITDTLSNTYEVIAPTVIPNVDGNTITVQFVTADVLPTVDVDYDSLAFTPGQADLSPEFRTAGAIGSQILFSAPDYEYTMTTSWVDSAQENQAQVGDSIVDSLGKEFVITFLDPTNRFSDPIRVEEKEKIGVAPTLGTATLFRGTTNFQFFQGTPLTDPARTTIFHRDEALTDILLKQLQDATSNLSAEFTVSPYLNNSGVTLNKGRPVFVNASGEINLVDVSVEAEALSVQGVVKESILTGQTGDVVTAGIVKDIAAPATIGSVVYIDKSGALSAIKPEIGVAGFVSGDFVVMMGSIKANEDVPTNKDLKLEIQVIGQL